MQHIINGLNYGGAIPNWVHTVTATHGPINVCCCLCLSGNHVATLNSGMFRQSYVYPRRINIILNVSTWTINEWALSQRFVASRFSVACVISNWCLGGPFQDSWYIMQLAMIVTPLSWRMAPCIDNMLWRILGQLKKSPFSRNIVFRLSFYMNNNR